MYTNVKDVLKFISNKIFAEMTLHEEYYVCLNKIQSSQEGRDVFLDIIERRFNPSQKVMLGKNSFQNLKDSLDLLLFEAEKEVDASSVIRLLPFLDTFVQKSTLKEEEGALKKKVREHLIFKSSKVWKAMLEKSIQQVQLIQGNQDEQELKQKIFTVIERVIDEMFEFRVPYEIVEQMFEDQQIDRLGFKDRVEAINKKLASSKEKQQEEKKQEAEKAKKKQQPQKGIPDWL